MENDYKITMGCLTAESAREAISDYEHAPHIAGALAFTYARTIGSAAAKHSIDMDQLFGPDTENDDPMHAYERVINMLEGPLALEGHLIYEKVITESTADSIERLENTIINFVRSRRGLNYYYDEEIDAFESRVQELNYYIMDPLWLYTAHTDTMGVDSSSQSTHKATDAATAGENRTLLDVAAYYNHGNKSLFLPAKPKDLDFEAQVIDHELGHACQPHGFGVIGFSEVIYTPQGQLLTGDSLNEGWNERKTKLALGIEPLHDDDVYFQEATIINSLLSYVPERIWDDYNSPLNINNPSGRYDSLQVLDAHLDDQFGVDFRRKLDTTLALKGFDYVIDIMKDGDPRPTLKRKLMDVHYEELPTLLVPR